jgi:hypothetical protein
VTVLGEFLPLGRWFTLESFFEETAENDQFFGLLISTVLYFQIWFGYILGNIFQNSSGHPGQDVLERKKKILFFASKQTWHDKYLKVFP